MIALKEVIHFPELNSVGATWVKRTQPADIEVPAVDAVLDEEGNIVSPAVAAHSVTPDPVEVRIKCHSYADVQMQMLRDDLGADASIYETLITLVESNIIPPAPKTDAQHNNDVLAEISALEKEQLLPRPIRGVLLELPGASGKGWYAKIKKLDDDIVAYRAQLRVIV